MPFDLSLPPWLIAGGVGAGLLVLLGWLLRRGRSFDSASAALDHINKERERAEALEKWGGSTSRSVADRIARGLAVLRRRRNR